MTDTPDLLGSLATRQDRLPMAIPHSRDWCPAKNCPTACGPHDCPVNRRRRNLTAVQQPSLVFQPSLFSQPHKEVPQ